MNILLKLDIVKKKSGTINIINVVNDFVCLKHTKHPSWGNWSERNLSIIIFPLAMQQFCCMSLPWSEAQRNHCRLPLQMRRPHWITIPQRYKVLYNFRKDSPSRNVSVHLMIPTIWLALLITFWICTSKFRHSSKVSLIFFLTTLFNTCYHLSCIHLVIQSEVNLANVEYFRSGILRCIKIKIPCVRLHLENLSIFYSSVSCIT